MKRKSLLATLLACTLLLSLSACGDSGQGGKGTSPSRQEMMDQVAAYEEEEAEAAGQDDTTAYGSTDGLTLANVSMTIPAGFTEDPEDGTETECYYISTNGTNSSMIYISIQYLGVKADSATLEAMKSGMTSLEGAGGISEATTMKVSGYDAISFTYSQDSIDGTGYLKAVLVGVEDEIVAFLYMSTSEDFTAFDTAMGTVKITP